MKIVLTFIVFLAASAYAEEDSSSSSTSADTLTAIVDSLGEVTSTTDTDLSSVLETLSTTVSELFSDVEDSESTVAAEATTSIELLNTITETLQGIVETATSTVTDAVETVTTEITEFIGTVNDKGDELLAELASAVGVDLTEDVAACVVTAKDEGVELVQTLVEQTIDCPLEIVQGLADNIITLIGAPASAVSLVETAIADLTACKEDNSNILLRVACVAKTVIIVQVDAATLGVEVTSAVTDTTSTVATLRETLLSCVAANLVSDALPLATIIAEMGVCSLTTLFS